MTNRVNILFTRPISGLREAQLALPPEQFRVVPCPTIEIQPVALTTFLNELLHRVAEFDFAVFTSQAAVESTVEHMRSLRVGLEQFSRTCICAVGSVTAAKLQSLGIKVDVVPNKFTAKALADVFPTMRTHGPSVFFPRSNLSSDVLIDALVTKGYKVTSPVLYENRPCNRLEAGAERIIAAGRAHCLAFTSPSSVLAFKSLLGDEAFSGLIKKAAVAAIGPVTAAACAKAGVWQVTQPEHCTLRSLAMEIADIFTNHETPINQRGSREA